MFRQNTYTEGNMGVCIPVGRQQVVPGQTIDLDVSTMFETPPFERQVLTGARVSLYAFYVPFRLLWDDWPDFVAQDTGLNVPQVSTDMPQIFERYTTNQPVSVLGRRAYKLIYNQFFGDKHTAYGESTGVADANDAIVGNKPVRGLNQLIGHLIDTDDTVDQVFEAPVASNKASIPLNAFRQALNTAKSKRRADMTGDKYVDALGRMGVKLDWRVQMAPEFLGAVHKQVWPKRTRVTTKTDQGRPVAYFSEQMNLKTGRRFIAEHGIVFTVLVFRPTLFALSTGATPVPAEHCMDSLQLGRQSFWLGDNQAGVTTVKDKYFSADNAGFSNMPRFGQYKWGQNLFGFVSDTATYGLPWTSINKPLNIREAVFPLIDFDPAPERGYEIVAVSQWADGGVSPVKMTL